VQENPPCDGFALVLKMIQSKRIEDEQIPVLKWNNAGDQTPYRMMIEGDGINGAGIRERK
jgi:hypothetical protein